MSNAWLLWYELTYPMMQGSCVRAQIDQIRAHVKDEEAS